MTKKQKKLRERLEQVKERAAELARTTQDLQIKQAANLAEEAAVIGLEILEEA